MPDITDAVRCVNHAEVAATHTADMPSATRPYREDVPLCEPCAVRIEAIGFPISEASHA